jgi:hypothetical protein
MMIGDFSCAQKPPRGRNKGSAARTAAPEPIALSNFLREIFFSFFFM